MYDYRESWKKIIAGTLTLLLEDIGIWEKVRTEQVIMEIPPNPQMGDIGFPMFSYAKLLRKGPPQIALMMEAALKKVLFFEGLPGTAQAQGPYINIKLNRARTARSVLEEFFKDIKNLSFGRPGTLDGKKVMVEFSSPNTNKPLHLGHLRNDALGESVSRILSACGAQVRKVCIINDR
ncbi:MAG: arginine--tRNA ligase, partial [Treponema sp.]|nr:arginine--tRNA ligase [Treponema sp.]